MMRTPRPYALNKPGSRRSRMRVIIYASLILASLEIAEWVHGYGDHGYFLLHRQDGRMWIYSVSDRGLFEVEAGYANSASGIYFLNCWSFRYSERNPKNDPAYSIDARPAWYHFFEYRSRPDWTGGFAETSLDLVIAI